MLLSYIFKNLKTRWIKNLNEVFYCEYISKYFSCKWEILNFKSRQMVRIKVKTKKKAFKYLMKCSLIMNDNIYIYIWYPSIVIPVYYYAFSNTNSTSRNFFSVFKNAHSKEAQKICFSLWINNIFFQLIMLHKEFI